MGRIKTSDAELSRKEVIVAKAATLFKEKGFKAASMRELAEVVGVEAASLYNHIKSKNELLHSICFDVASRYNNMLTEIEATDCSSIEKVEKLLRFLISGMVLQYDHVYVSDREWKHLPEPYLSDFHQQRRSFRKRIAAIIEDGIAKNEIKPVDAPTAVLILLHAVSGIESWHRSKAKINGLALEESMLTILVGGLKNTHIS